MWVRSGMTVRVRMAPWRRHRFTDAEYDAMVIAGVLSGTRTFLCAGEIVKPLAEDQPHLGIVSAIFALLIARFARSDWAIHLDQQVTVAPGYRPEPDLSLLRGSARSWSVRGKGSGTIEGTGRRVTWGDNRATSVIEVSEHPRDWATTPLALAVDLQPGAVQDQVERPGGLLRQRDPDRGGPAAEGGVIGDGQVQVHQPEERVGEPLGRPQGRAIA